MAAHVGCAGSRSGSKTLRNPRVGIPYAKPVSRIMRPSGQSNSAISTAETVAVEESGVDEKTAAKPVRTPSPAAPTTPAAEEQSHINSRPEPEAKRRVVESRIIAAIDWRSPDVHWIVLRHINNLWVGRLDLDGRLSVIGLSGHRFLR